MFGGASEVRTRTLAAAAPHSVLPHKGPAQPPGPLGVGVQASRGWVQGHARWMVHLCSEFGRAKNSPLIRLPRWPVQAATAPPSRGSNERVYRVSLTIFKLTYWFRGTIPQPTGEKTGQTRWLRSSRRTALKRIWHIQARFWPSLSGERT